MFVPTVDSATDSTLGGTMTRCSRSPSVGPGALTSYGLDPEPRGRPKARLICHGNGEVDVHVR